MKIADINSTVGTAKKKKREAEFTSNVKEVLAQRVAYLCSNPECNVLTVGPNKQNKGKAVKIGEACHIKGEAPNSARYDVSMSIDERKSIDNAIWLCRNCHIQIDSDPITYYVEYLYNWKEKAENKADVRLGKLLMVDYTKTEYLSSYNFLKTSTINITESRKAELKILQTGINSVIIVHGLPQIGKTTLVCHWLNQLYVDSEYIIRRLNGRNPEWLEDEAMTDPESFINMVKQSGVKWVLFFENFQHLLNDRRFIKSQRLERFFNEIRRTEISNLTIVINSWYNPDIFQTWNDHVIYIPLKGYEIPDLANKFYANGITKIQFNKLKLKYQSHPLLLERSLDLIENFRFTYADLWADSKSILGVLESYYDDLFSNIQSDIRDAFFEIVIEESIPSTIPPYILKKLADHNLINQTGYCTYNVHNWVLDLAHEYFENSDDFKNKGLKIISGLICKMNETTDSKTRFDIANKTLKIVIIINKKISDFKELEDSIKELMQGDNIRMFFCADSTKNIEILSYLKDIIKEEYFLYCSVNYRKNKDFDRAQNELDLYLQGKKNSGTYDEKSKYNYNCQKGTIHREKNEIEEAIISFKIAIENRGFLDIENANNILIDELRKNVIKSYLTPVIELSNIYIRQDKLVEAKKILFKEYQIIEKYEIINNAIYNELGDLFRELNDEEKAIKCYARAYEIKPWHYKTLFYLSSLNFKKKNYSEALKYLKYGINGDIFKPNLYIYNWAAICFREVGVDYDKCHKYLQKSFEECLDFNKNQFAYKESIITYIKSADFENASRAFQPEIYERLIPSIIRIPDYLLMNVSNEVKSKIIDWLFEQYDKYQEVINVTLINKLYAEKIKVLISLENLNYLSLFIDEIIEKSFFLDISAFNKIESNIIVDICEKKLALYFKFKKYRGYLFLFVSFSDNKRQCYLKLNSFFNIPTLTSIKDNNILFRKYLDLSLIMKKVEFVSIFKKAVEICLMPNLTSYLKPVANLCSEKKMFNKAEYFYKLAITHSDDFDVFFDYSIFLLSTCKFEEFWNLFDTVVEKFKTETEDKKANSARKRTIHRYRAIINDADFNMHAPADIDYYTFINKYILYIIRTELEFRTELQLKLLLSFYDSDQKNIKYIYSIVDELYSKEKYFIFINFYKENKKELINTFQLAKMYQTSNKKLIEIAKQKKELLNGKSKAELIDIANVANQYFKYGAYANAFELYLTIINDFDERISSVVTNYLDRLVFSAKKASMPIKSELIDSPQMLFELGVKYISNRRFNRAIECLNNYLTKSIKEEQRISCYIKLAQTYLLCNNYEKALESVDNCNDFIENYQNEPGYFNKMSGDFVMIKAKAFANLKMFEKAFHLLNGYYIISQKEIFLKVKNRIITDNNIEKAYQYELIYSDALLAYKNKEYDIAIKLIRPIFLIQPQNSEIAKFYAELLLESKTTEDTEIIDLYTDNYFVNDLHDLELLKALGDLYLMHNDIEKASIFYNKAKPSLISDGNTDYQTAMFFYNIAKFAFEIDNKAEANTYWGNALQNDPQNPIIVKSYVKFICGNNIDIDERTISIFIKNHSYSTDYFSPDFDLFLCLGNFYKYIKEYKLSEYFYKKLNSFCDNIDSHIFTCYFNLLSLKVLCISPVSDEKLLEVENLFVDIYGLLIGFEQNKVERYLISIKALKELSIKALKEYFDLEINNN